MKGEVVVKICFNKEFIRINTQIVLVHNEIAITERRLAIQHATFIHASEQWIGKKYESDQTIILLPL